uniref:Uncharacterized protein n=1 Tax=Anguilla anguilla TaxID=7936 RepID=A0A0E9SWT4_ANGAN
MYYFSAAMVLQCKGRHFFPSLSENILSLRSVLSDPWQATLSRDN